MATIVGVDRRRTSSEWCASAPRARAWWGVREDAGAPSRRAGTSMAVVDEAFDAHGLVADRARALSERGRHAEAVRTLERAIGERRRRHDEIGGAGLGVTLGSAWLLRGRVREAETVLRAALEVFERFRLDASILTGCFHLGRLLLEDDRLDECADVLRRATALADAIGDALAARRARVELAHCALWAHRIDDAARLLAETAATHAVPCGGVSDVRTGGGWGAARDDVAGVWPPPSAGVLERLVRGRAALLAGSRDRLTWAGEAVLPHESRSRSSLDLVAGCESNLFGLALAESWVAVEEEAWRGIRAAERAHAPLAALSVRLTCGECLARRRPSGSEEAAGAATALRGWARASLPGLYRRRLCELLKARDGDTRRVPTGVGLASVPRHAIDMLRVLNDAHDEQQGLERVCGATCRQLRAAALTVFGRTAAGSHQILAHLGGRPCDADLVSRAGASGVRADGGGAASAAQVVVPIAYGGACIGAAGARWPSGEPPPGDAATVLEIFAGACAPSVRALLDRRPEPAPDAGPTGSIVGVSGAARELRALVVKAAATPFPVLIEGESGTGKELAARAIHVASTRRARRLCAVNCAALADELLEAELFGAARGAFTGAVADRPGLFEEADGGTLFFDEISELSARAQAKLLRAIQEGEVRRLGETTHRRVDVRIVAATNRSLAEECARGRFRRDLLYRLDVVRISVPPLRERRGDIPLLVERFWRQTSTAAASRAVLSADALAALSRHDWPGNVRELQNALAALAVRGPGTGRLGARDIAAVLGGPVPGAAREGPGTLWEARRRFEMEYVAAALARAGGRRTRAARDLGITRQGLAKLVSRLGLAEPTGGAAAP